MSVRRVCYKIYRAMKSLIAPRLKYSQRIYEETLKSTCKPGVVWLDMGCGHHVLPTWRADQEKELVDSCRDVVGLDYDLPSLQKHKTIEKRVRGDISRLPFANGSFDLVTSNMVFEHLREPEVQLAEVNRVLKPGGLLLFHTPNNLGYVTIIAKLVPEAIKGRLIRFLERRDEEDVFPTYYRINSRSQIAELAGTTGFEVKQNRLIASSAKLVMIPPLALLELLWIRLLMTKPMKPFRTGIIAILEKSSDRAGA